MSCFWHSAPHASHTAHTPQIATDNSLSRDMYAAASRQISAQSMSSAMQRAIGWGFASFRHEAARLFAEQLDPTTDEHMRNFPQACTHIALVNSAITLENADGAS